MAIGPGYSFTVRLEIESRPGMLGRVMTRIGELGGGVGAIDIVKAGMRRVVRDVTVYATDVGHMERIVEALRGLEGVGVVSVSDRVFLAHLGGKIEIEPRMRVRTRDDLSLVYTPGVARVGMAIKEDREKVYKLTIKKNTVAIVTDGSAVLGLGDIGPEAALPVMEGKAMLFKEFGGVDAFPICISSRDPSEIVRTVEMISAPFGGINLEDISAPRCFEIEEALSARLDIPVFHDDQHGTAVVVLAALLNALKVVGKEMGSVRVVVSGVGAAGLATTRLLLKAGVGDIIGVDSKGIIYRGRREGMTPIKEWYAAHTNREGIRGGLDRAVEGADVFIGLSVPGILRPEWVERMEDGAIVFALANPEPEILPEEVPGNVRVFGTGRSDYPNQINNVLCFPGFFRGLLDCRAKGINDEMRLAAARAIAGVVGEGELSEEYIVPSVFDRRVAEAVATSVVRAAVETGMARRKVLHAS